MTPPRTCAVPDCFNPALPGRLYCSAGCTEIKPQSRRPRTIPEIQAVMQTWAEARRPIQLHPKETEISDPELVSMFTQENYPAPIIEPPGLRGL